MSPLATMQEELVVSRCVAKREDGSFVSPLAAMQELLASRWVAKEKDGSFVSPLQTM